MDRAVSTVAYLFRQALEVLFEILAFILYTLADWLGFNEPD